MPDARWSRCPHVFRRQPPRHRVKLLLDQKLSRMLVARLGDAFLGSSHVSLGSSHVSAVGLDAASDRQVWDYAREHGFAVVSKDSDFRQLAFDTPQDDSLLVIPDCQADRRCTLREDHAAHSRHDHDE